jgi:hypothetical protein
MFTKILFYDDVGRSKVMGRPLGAIQIPLVFLTFLKVYGISLNCWQIVLLAVGYFVFEMVCGWFYVRLGFYEIETDFGIEQNKVLRKWK